MSTTPPVVSRGYHNIQQLSDAIIALEDVSGKSQRNEADFIVSQVQPLTAAIATLQSQVAALQAQVAALIGTPKV